MDEETTRRIARALEGALAVFRDGKGRLSAADIRVQSIIAAVRSAMMQRMEGGSLDALGGLGSHSPFRALWESDPKQRPE